MHILLLLHDVSLSGAPKSIYLVCKELSEKGYEFTILTQHGGGKLEQQFKDISCKYYSLDIYSRKTNYTFKNRILKRFFGKRIVSEYDNILNKVYTIKYDCIYVNTIVPLTLALFLKKKIQCKLILHIHELDTVIKEFHPYLHKDDNSIDLYIVPSKINENCLTEKYQIPFEKIFIVRETSDDITSFYKKRKETKQKTILMCGGAYWRKGDDIFLLIAKIILNKQPNVIFFWIGYQSDERKRVNTADVEKLGIKDSIFFKDETTDPLKWYLNSDVFLLSSREDPFPLAAIDAGMIGLPIFCFEKATGISEVINSSCVIPYLDLELMATRILEVLNNENELLLLSKENKQTFKEFIPKKISKQIEQILINICLA